jgi:hypothetical protein
VWWDHAALAHERAHARPITRGGGHVGGIAVVIQPVSLMTATGHLGVENRDRFSGMMVHRIDDPEDVAMIGHVRSGST